MLMQQSPSEEEEEDWIFAVADTTVGSVDVAGGGGMGETEPDL